MEISVREFPKAPWPHAEKYCYFHCNPSYSSNFGRLSYGFACQEKNSCVWFWHFLTRAVSGMVLSKGSVKLKKTVVLFILRITKFP